MAFWGNCYIESKITLGLEYIEKFKNNYECVIHHRSNKYRLNINITNNNNNNNIQICFRNTILIEYDIHNKTMYRQYFRNTDGTMCWHKWEGEAKKAIEEFYNVKPKCKHFTRYEYQTMSQFPVPYKE